MAASFVGSFYPLFRRDKARSSAEIPLSEAFTAGVLIALSLTLMLPSSFQLLQTVFPSIEYPVTSIIVLTTFFVLLGLEHLSQRMEKTAAASEQNLTPPAIPLIMTAMIAVPSFFLGTALGVSSTRAALLIFIAIMLAGFFLAAFVRYLIGEAHGSG